MTTICDSVDAVARAVSSAGWARIGIDGVDGSGKSSLAASLALQLGSVALDLDDFLNKNQGGFVEFLDYEALRAAMSETPMLVISGVCLRAALYRMDCSLDAHIYVKRTRHELWADEPECVFPDGLPAAIAEHRRNAALLARFESGEPVGAGAQVAEVQHSLTEEIMRYHDDYRPHEVADLVFERSDHAS
jgi:hypothetical protein